jgi:hypothetical protein
MMDSYNKYCEVLNEVNIKILFINKMKRKDIEQIDYEPYSHKTNSEIIRLMKLNNKYDKIISKIK